MRDCCVFPAIPWVPMPDVDDRLRTALTAQLQARSRALEAGAVPVGWKLGVGDAELIAQHVAVGHLSSHTLLVPGATFVPEQHAALHADAELALELGRDLWADADDSSARAAIAAYGSALEIVDLGDAARGAEAVVESNIFHRAVVFGDFRPSPPTDGTAARLLVNGAVRAAGPMPTDVIDRIRAAAGVLGSVDQQLRAGDRVITGSIVQVAISRGDRVVADLADLGQVTATMAA